MIRITLIFALLLIAYFATLRSNETLVCFVDKDIDKKLVIAAFDLLELNHIKLVFTEYENVSCDLILIKSNILNYGEHFHKTITISSKYKFTERQTINLIAHELGHYFGLTHSDDLNSIMNINTKLCNKTVTRIDKIRLQTLSKKLFIIKFKNKITEKFAVACVDLPHK